MLIFLTTNLVKLQSLQPHLEFIILFGQRQYVKFELKQGVDFHIGIGILPLSQNRACWNQGLFSRVFLSDNISGANQPLGINRANQHDGGVERVYLYQGRWNLVGGCSEKHNAICTICTKWFRVLPFPLPAPHIVFLILTSP